MILSPPHPPPPHHLPPSQPQAYWQHLIQNLCVFLLPEEEEGGGSGAADTQHKCEWSSMITCYLRGRLHTLSYNKNRKKNRKLVPVAWITQKLPAAATRNCRPKYKSGEEPELRLGRAEPGGSGCITVTFYYSTTLVLIMSSEEPRPSSATCL